MESSPWKSTTPSGAWVAMHPAEAASLPVTVWATGERGIEDEQWLRRCGLLKDVIAELVIQPLAEGDQVVAG